MWAIRREWQDRYPPGPYGVHAAPVGRLLRAYGLPADDKRGLSWDELRAEIAQGQPVIVWVIGGGADGIWGGLHRLGWADDEGGAV